MFSYLELSEYEMESCDGFLSMYQGFFLFVRYSDSFLIIFRLLIQTVHYLLHVRKRKFDLFFSQTTGIFDEDCYDSSH